ncbi:hypothetical protein EDC65_0199 [Stella humosa]|uniref:Uncharacterized protein n=1 Tax=Stella humosa TaxID=94 RepID=A0A3N1MEA6_9PROT|nr:hypothetical protein [Stella humosa]ROQ01027.1 hypothetical protein EDC65_0199 [Stella humosa]BBK31396.1 hypothetical protein STHU_20300 [Stella humosa]
MPLQNRVLPDGEIVAIPERGLFTGNRGIIHDPERRALLPRRWTSRRWIVCLCAFKGVRRPVMGRQSWTELFFLDEATAFSAGHRPCFYCRRPEARAFQAAWALAHGGPPPGADAMDLALHAERLDGRAKRRHPLPGPPAGLPDGTMVAAGDAAFLLRGGRAWRWAAAGYQPASTLPGGLVLLTPPSIVRTMAAGYRPVLHPSLADA